MQIQKNIPLADYTTMRLGGPAKFLVDVHSTIDLQNTIKWAKPHDMKIVVIGGGSNVLFTDEGFTGLVIVNKITGFETLSQDDASTTIKIGGGEIWDSVVQKTTEMGLSGIEALSMVPGTAGAAPVQNIGAYGQELATTFVELEAYDLDTDEIVVLDKEQCGFGYRTSIFKNSNPRRYIITSITLKLSRSWMSVPFYDSLQKYLMENDITEYSPSNIRAATIAIRANKLPNPKDLASCGSFFKNAVVEKTKFDELRLKYPKIPGFTANNDKIKIPAAWLVEKAGFKGAHDENGMGTYQKHALVVVNYSAKSYKDLEDFTAKIIAAVQTKFGVSLEREPELISSS